MKNKWIKIIIIIGVILGVMFLYVSFIMLLPLIVDSVDGLFKEINFDDNWLLFWGSFTGGILTVFGVLYTIRFYKKQDYEKWEKSIMPFLAVKLGKEPPDVLYKIEKHGIGKRIVFFYNVKNIGNGAAIIKETNYYINEGVRVKKYTKIPLAESICINKGEDCTFRVNKDSVFKNIKIVIIYKSISEKEYSREFNIKVDDNGDWKIDGIDELEKEETVKNLYMDKKHWKKKKGHK